MKHAIFFDMDNTLIDRTDAAINAYKELCQLTFPNDQQKQQEMFDICWKYDDGGQIPGIRRFQSIRDELGFDEDWIFESQDWWEVNYPRFTKIYPKTYETLDILKKDYRLGMITDGPSIMQRGKLSRTNLEPYFETIVISGELGMEKPNSKIFKYALDQMQVEASDAYYVGDTAWKDVAGSYRVGMTPIHICPDDDKVCPGFLRIKYIEDLVDLLKEHNK